jgi:hypothetical protein
VKGTHVLQEETQLWLYTGTAVWRNCGGGRLCSKKELY